MDNESLAKFQTAMLEALSQHQGAETLRDALLSHPDCAPYHDWIQSMRPDMLETAASLVKKWNSKDESEAIGL